MLGELKEQEMKKERKKIILTGGHAATTALATMEELKISTKFRWELIWVGAKYAFEGKDILNIEFKVFPKHDIKCIPIVAGKLQRRISLYTLPAFFRLPIGFLMAFLILVREKPDIILSFGGYAAVPVVIVGWILRIPIVIQEQIMTAGMANKLTSRYAKKIAVARRESIEFFPKEKTVLTGNPVMKSIIQVKPKFQLERNKKPVVFVMGGSRGSHTLNSIISEGLERLLTEYKLIHVTGDLDYKELTEKRHNLSFDLRKDYKIYDFVDPMKIADLYNLSDIVIGRGGANSVSEIMLTARPAILVPIPKTWNDEQNKNANYARESGIARVIPQSKLTPERLLKDLFQIRKNWEKMVRQVVGMKLIDREAAERLVDILEECV
ncbi:hypothetical protein A2191_00690, partial [Candidatus Woesebacteria bacterium RIFOXYA1_FULL_38_9]